GGTRTRTGVTPQGIFVPLWLSPPGPSGLWSGRCLLHAPRWVFRREPSRLYTLPAPGGPALARRSHQHDPEGFADFDSIHAEASRRRAQILKSLVSTIPPRGQTVIILLTPAPPRWPTPSPWSWPVRPGPAA